MVLEGFGVHGEKFCSKNSYYFVILITIFL